MCLWQQSDDERRNFCSLLYETETVGGQSMHSVQTHHISDRIALCQLHMAPSVWEYSGADSSCNAICVVGHSSRDRVYEHHASINHPPAACSTKLLVCEFLRRVAPVSSQNLGCQRSEDVWMMGDGGSTVVIVHSTRTLSVSLNVAIIEWIFDDAIIDVIPMMSSFVMMVTWTPGSHARIFLLLSLSFCSVVCYDSCWAP